MPKIEIDEEEHNRNLQLRSVLGKVIANPAAKKLMEQAHKLVDPNVTTPTLDAERAINEPITELEKRLTEKVDGITKTLEERDRQARINEIAAKQAADKDRLRTVERYTDEGITAIEKLMTDKGLLDVMDAVAIFERNNPPPAPVTPGIGGWGFLDSTAEAADKNIADLIASRGQNDQIADRIARETINEIRGPVRR